MSPIRARNTDFEFTTAFSVPDPGAANADIANFYGFTMPFDAEITKIELVPHAAYVAAAAANDATVAVKRNNTGTAVASLNIVTALAQGSQNNMGTLDGTTKFFASGDKVTVDVTTNGTADAPAQTVVVRYRARQGK